MDPHVQGGRQGGVPGHGIKHRSYDYETKLAAARDFVDLGMTRQEVMSKHGIANLTQLKKWARAYREGGPEALRPKPKGRPRKDGIGSPGPKSREQELEAENRRLRAEVVYLKNCVPWRRQGERLGEVPGDQGSQGKGTRSGTCWPPGVPASTYHYNKSKPAKAPTRPSFGTRRSRSSRARRTAAGTAR